MKNSKDYRAIDAERDKSEWTHRPILEGTEQGLGYPGTLTHPTTGEMCAITSVARGYVAKDTAFAGREFLQAKQDAKNAEVARQNRKRKAEAEASASSSTASGDNTMCR